MPTQEVWSLKTGSHQPSKIIVIQILYTDTMDHSLSPDFQRSIQQSLQEIAAQMGKPLNEIAAERLYQDATVLVNHAPEPITLARVAATLLVYGTQNTEPEELEWFKSQVQLCSNDEEIEELIESLHRTDAL